MENHTHVPSVVILRVQSSRNENFHEICEIYTPENNLLTVYVLVLG